MNELKFGQAYFDVLSTIKDQVSANLAQTCLELGVDQETTRKLLYVAQSTVDSSGGNGLPALKKSCK